MARVYLNKVLIFSEFAPLISIGLEWITLCGRGTIVCTCLYGCVYVHMCVPPTHETQRLPIAIIFKISSTDTKKVQTLTHLIIKIGSKRRFIFY